MMSFIVFAISRSGSCVINGYGGGGVPGGSRAAARSAACLAGPATWWRQTGDYSFSQIAGSVTDSQIAGEVNAFQDRRGNGRESGFRVSGERHLRFADAAQRKSGAQPLSGERYRAISEAQPLWPAKRAVAGMAPSDGQALVWSASANQWQPGTVSGSGGGGGGASMASQLE